MGFSLRCLGLVVLLECVSCSGPQPTSDADECAPCTCAEDASMLDGADSDARTTDADGADAGATDAARDASSAETCTAHVFLGPIIRQIETRLHLCSAQSTVSELRITIYRDRVPMRTLIGYCGAGSGDVDLGQMEQGRYELYITSGEGDRAGEVLRDPSLCPLNPRPPINVCAPVDIIVDDCGRMIVPVLLLV